jgi:hypothetical protein
MPRSSLGMTIWGMTIGGMTVWGSGGSPPLPHSGMNSPGLSPDFHRIGSEASPIRRRQGMPHPQEYQPGTARLRPAEIFPRRRKSRDGIAFAIPSCPAPPATGQRGPSDEPFPLSRLTGEPHFQAASIVREPRSSQVGKPIFLVPAIYVLRPFTPVPAMRRSSSDRWHPQLLDAPFARRGFV